MRIRKKFRHKETDARIEFYNDFTYGITAEGNLYETLSEYASKGKKPSISRLTSQTGIDSFEKANEVSDEVWLIKTQKQEKQNEYCVSATFEILDVLRGDYKVSTSDPEKNLYMEVIPASQEVENGEVYLMFRKLDPIHNTMSIASKEYCL